MIDRLEQEVDRLRERVRLNEEAINRLQELMAELKDDDESRCPVCGDTTCTCYHDEA